MSVPGQTEKNSIRANVVRVTLESGSPAMQSACRKCANCRRSPMRGNRIEANIITCRLARIAPGYIGSYSTRVPEAHCVQVESGGARGGVGHGNDPDTAISG